MALAIRNPTLNGVSKDGFYLGTKDGSTTARADGQLKSGRGEKDFDDHMCAHHCKVAAQLPQHAQAEGDQSSSSEPTEAEAECGNEFTEAALAVTRPSMSPGKAMEGVPPTCQPEGAAWIIFCTLGPRRQQRHGLEPSRIVMGGAASLGSALSASQLKKIASERAAAYRSANITPANETGDRGATQADQHRQKNIQSQEDRLAEARLERQALVTLESTKAALESLQVHVVYYHCCYHHIIIIVVIIHYCCYCCVIIRAKWPASCSSGRRSFKWQPTLISLRNCVMPPWCNWHALRVNTRACGLRWLSCGLNSGT